MKLFVKLKEIICHNQFAAALVLAVLIAALTTTVGIKLYKNNDVSRLDLSLPGHEKSRENIESVDPNNFEGVGPVNLDVVDNFQKLIDKKRAALNVLDKFDGDRLTDDSLKITTNQ